MRIKIGTKLIVSFSIILLITAYVGVMGIRLAAEINQNANEINENWLVKTRILGEMNGLNADYQNNVLHYIFAYYRGDQGKATEFEPIMVQKASQFDNKITELQKLVKTEQDKKMLGKVRISWGELRDVVDRETNLAKTGRNNEAVSSSLGELKQSYDALNASMADFVNYNHRQSEAKVIENKSAYNMGLKSGIVTILFALAFGLGLGFYIARGIARPANLLAQNALKVAEGNLTVDKIEVKTRDEISDIADSFSIMVVNLRGIIEQINSSSRFVADTSRQLNSNADGVTKFTRQVVAAIEGVARGTANQNQSVTETVKTVDQVSQAIAQISEGAHEQSRNIMTTVELVGSMSERIDVMAQGMEQIKDSSEQSGLVAMQGGSAVEKTVVGMGRVKDAVYATANRIKELGEQSQQIGEIIQVIDEIADQTNLLALNAAIEAARAGNHGKGFAVVADEVRNLAERSGKATKQIVQLVTNIQKGTMVAVESMEVGTREVEEGVIVAQEAGSALEKIVKAVEYNKVSVQKITEIINEILLNSREVTNAIDNVAAITEENTASTEEMAASAKHVHKAMENIAAAAGESASAVKEVSTSTEEMTASIEEIAISAKELFETASNLNELVSKFNIGNLN